MLIPKCHQRSIGLYNGPIRPIIQKRNVVQDNFAPKTDIMLPKGCFEGKIAFVTGGGTGLGKGMAARLSSLGAKVAISSRKVNCKDVHKPELLQNQPLTSVRTKWETCKYTF